MYVFNELNFKILIEKCLFQINSWTVFINSVIYTQSCVASFVCERFACLQGQMLDFEHS